MTDTLVRSIFGYGNPWGYPYFEGDASEGDPYVPWLKPVSINGVGFVINFDKYKRTTMQLRRLATDDSVEPAEQSLNSSGLWPRAQDNFFLGGGQLFLDNRFAFENVYTNSGEFPSVRTRYWRSKGVNPWKEGKLSLHKEQQVLKTSTHANLFLVATDTRLYFSSGAELYWSADGGATWTAAGVAAIGGGNNITSLTTTGTFVYAALGAGGIAKTADGATTATAWSTYAAVLIGYANGHLVGSTGRDLTEIAADGTFGSAFHTQPDTNFLWTSICASPSAIIVGGNAGAESFIGAVQPSAATEGATLDPPITATVLPPGELINAMQYSTGLMLLATSLGVRSGTRPDSTGVFDIYPVITDVGPSQCLAPWHEFMYFGCNYDTADGVVQPVSVVSPGLCRANMSQFQQTNGVPAYASDVMAADGSSAPVLSVAMWNGDPYFTVSGSGVWGPSGDLVEEGTYVSGWIRYGTTEPKIFVDEKLWHEPLLIGQSIDVNVANEFADVVALGSSATTGATSSDYLGGTLFVGDRFMSLLTLNRGTDTTQGPTLYYWQANAMVAPRRQDEIILPIILTSEVTAVEIDGLPFKQDTLALFQFLKALELAGAPVLYQEGSLTQQAFIDQIQVTPSGMNNDRTWFEVPELIVKLMTLGTGT